MATLARVFELKNLRRAYQWLLSNPNAAYKAHFRDSYDAFALSSDTYLKGLRKEGLEHRYSPNHASKLMLPKPSGTLRPLTLLTVEDQIVYQAIVNVVAEALKPRTRKRYRKSVFAHLYAGKSSPYFYLRWQDSYRLFGRGITHLYNQGFTHIAEFDLAAFYDSIDHHVICHFLREVGIEEEVIQLLMTCLEKWTSSTWSNGPAAIYHRHGIPQGPLSSGMLSEVVLQHIDAAGERGKKTRYLRYVDDIKILAKKEGELRRKLISLDLASKEIGLFPQTSKINIREIDDPVDEIKSISRPPEPAIWPAINQDRLTRRLLEITRRGHVDLKLSTRFRFLLAQSAPAHRLSERLLKVIRHHPEHSDAIGRYFSGYKTMPSSLAAQVLSYLNEPELYHAVSADLLRGTLRRMRPHDGMAVGLFCSDRLIRPKRGLLPIQPTYKEALIAWALVTKQLTFAEFEQLLNSETDWWIQKSMLRELSADQFGSPSYREVLNRMMRGPSGEVAMCSAFRLAEEALTLNRPYGDVHKAGKVILRTSKIIRSVGVPASLIGSVVAYVLKRNQTPYDWQRFFHAGHPHAEQISLFLKQSFETDIDAFLTRFDSFADAITAELFRRLLPNRTYPDYGAAVRNPTLAGQLPYAMGSFLTLHNLRLASMTAHPRSRRTGAGTRRLKHSDYRQIRPALVLAFDELERTIVP